MGIVNLTCSGSRDLHRDEDDSEPSHGSKAASAPEVAGANSELAIWAMAPLA